MSRQTEEMLFHAHPEPSPDYVADNYERALEKAKDEFREWELRGKVRYNARITKAKKWKADRKKGKRKSG